MMVPRSVPSYKSQHWKANLMLFEEAEVLPVGQLATLAMAAPLQRIAHRRHREILAGVGN